MVISSTAAAILAGGKSTRMAGRQKALLEIQGRALIDHVITTLRTVFDEIIIVSNNPDFRSACSHGCQLTTDHFCNVGPLGGIHAALSCCRHEAVFVCACDMPKLDPGNIRAMVRAYAENRSEVVLPRVGRLIEPLHAIYATRMASCLAEYLRTAQDYAIRNFLDTRNVRHIDFPPGEGARIFENINTMQDLRATQRRQSCHDLAH